MQVDDVDEVWEEWDDDDEEGYVSGWRWMARSKPLHLESSSWHVRKSVGRSDSQSFYIPHSQIAIVNQMYEDSERKYLFQCLLSSYSIILLYLVVFVCIPRKPCMSFSSLSNRTFFIHIHMGHKYILGWSTFSAMDAMDG